MLISSVEHQLAVRLQPSCAQSIPIEDLVPPGKPFLLARPGAVNIGVEKIVAVGNDRIIRVVRRRVGDAAGARRALEGQIVLVNLSSRVLYCPPLSVVRPWSISMIPQPPGVTVSLLPVTSTPCEAERRMSAPQNQSGSASRPLLAAVLLRMTALNEIS